MRMASCLHSYRDDFHKIFTAQECKKPTFGWCASLKKSSKTVLLKLPINMNVTELLQRLESLCVSLLFQVFIVSSGQKITGNHSLFQLSTLKERG